MSTATRSHELRQIVTRVCVRTVPIAIHLLTKVARRIRIAVIIVEIYVIQVFEIEHIEQIAVGLVVSGWFPKLNLQRTGVIADVICVVGKI